ncbi:MAG: hypothetical protein R2862_00820 [Thermoanaerobaculia bacterium]
MRTCVLLAAALLLAACGDAPAPAPPSAATETSYTALVTDAVEHSKEGSPPSRTPAPTRRI